MNFPRLASSRFPLVGRSSSLRARKARDRRRRFSLEALEDRVVMTVSPDVWTGAVSSSWFTAGNWSNGVPTATTPVEFSSSSSVSCNVDTGNAVAGSVTIDSGYTGSLTLNAGKNLTVSGAFDEEGGTFNAGSSTLSVTGNFTVAASPAAAFNAGTGTVAFANSGVTNQTITVNTNGQALYNVSINEASAGTLNVTNLPVGGNLLILRGNFLNGTIDVSGDVTTTAPAFGSSSASTQTGTIALVGNTNQTITAGPGINSQLKTTPAPLAPAQLPSILINQSPGGTVTLAAAGAAVNDLSGQPIMATMPPSTTPAAVTAGPIAVTGNWTNTSKSPVISTNSTVVFQYGAQVSSSSPETIAVDNGGQALNNVTINRAGPDTLAIKNGTSAGSLNVNGDLLITKLIAMTGTLNVAGNVTSTWNAPTGTIGGGGTINMVDLPGQHGTVSIAGGAFPSGGVTINKASSSIVNASVTMPLAGPLTLWKVLQLNGTFTVGAGVTTYLAPGTTDGIGTGGTITAPGAVLVFAKLPSQNAAATNNQTITSAVPGGSIPGVLINTKNNVTISASGANSLSVTGDWTNNGTVVAGSGATGSTVVFRNGWNGGTNKTIHINDGGSAFNNVTIQRDSNGTIDVTSLTVGGNLIVNRGQFLIGTIDVDGNVTTNDPSFGSASGSTQTGTIALVGSGAQTIAAGVPTDAMGKPITNGVAQLPSILINQTGTGTVTIDNSNSIAVTGNWDNESASAVTTIHASPTTAVVFQYGPAGGLGTTIAVNDGGSSFNNVAINRGSGDALNYSGSNTINGDLTVNSGAFNLGTSGTGGSLTVSGNVTVKGGAINFSDGGEGNLTVSNGALTVSGGAINFSDGEGGEIEVDNGATTISGGTISLGAGSEFNAYGGLTMSGGTINTGANSEVEPNGVATVSGGTINIGANGTLNAYNGITVSGGTINMGAGSQFEADNGTIAVSGGTINLKGAGSFIYAGDGLKVSGGTINLTGQGASISGSGGAVTVSGGAINLKGEATTLTAKSGLTVSSGAITLTGQGSEIDVTGGNMKVSGGTVDLTGQNDKIVVADPPQSGGFVTVSGGAINLKGAGSSLTAATGITVSSGAITLSGQGCKIDVTNGGVTVKTSGAAAAINLNGQSDKMTVSGGQVKLSGSNGNAKINLSGAGSSLTANSGVLVNTGAITLSGQGSKLDVTGGGAAVSGSGAINLNGQSDKMTVSGGQVKVAGSIYANHAAINLNGAGSSLTAKSGMLVSGGAITLTGLDSEVDVTGGDVTISGIGGAIALSGTGSKLDVTDGSVTVNSNGTLNVGPGSVSVAGTMTVSGALDFAPTATTSTQLAVTGSLTFNNGATITITDAGIPPSANYPLITYASETGWSAGMLSAPSGITLTFDTTSAELQKS